MNVTLLYNSIDQTPFILGLVLPNNYGHTKMTYTKELTLLLKGTQFEDDHCKEVYKSNPTEI